MTAERELFGPDGTASPPPDRWYPDPLAGLNPGATYAEPELIVGDPPTGPTPQLPDTEAVREAMEAVLADNPDDEQQSRKRPNQPRRGTAPRNEAAQPGRLPTRGGQSRRNSPGWASSAARGVNPANRPQRKKSSQPLRKQPGVLIVVALVLIVILFNLLSALFNWLNSAFH